MKKRQMIKIVGPQGEDRVDTPYKCKQFNCYAQALKCPTFYNMMRIHLKLVNLCCSTSFRMTYRLFKKERRKRRELQKSLKKVINCLAKDYVEQNNDMLGGKLK